jgi:predicted ArsR family transcriptional regulator
MTDAEAIAALHDPVRRRLYDYVAAAGHEVGRAEAADAVGAQRTLAAFHLDKLVEVGLLETGYRRLTGRTGPGAGRPAKVYRRAPGEHAVSVPARDYRTVATLLAEAVEDAGGDDRLNAAARRHGKAIGEAAHPEEVSTVLAAQGYEPYPADEETLRLRNCPFHALSTEFPPLVCGMNLALLEGVLDGLADPGLRARMGTRPGECCVVIDSKTNKD